MDSRAAALAALARFQVTETTVGEALQQIAEITLEAVTPAEAVGMSILGQDGRPTTAVYTDPESPAIDEAQYREGKGPCLDAWRQNKVIQVSRIDDVTDLYPAFATACRQHQVRSTLSVPMSAGDKALGAMNLYARAEEAFEEGDKEVASDLAVAGSAVLTNVAAYWDAYELGQQLTEALESRVVIEQAKGILMARDPNLSADAAFDVLRRASQRQNIKLREVAAHVIEQRRAIAPDDGEGRP